MKWFEEIWEKPKIAREPFKPISGYTRGDDGMHLSWISKNRLRQKQRAADLECLEGMVGTLVYSIEKHSLLLERLFELLECFASEPDEHDDGPGLGDVGPG